MRLKDVNPDQYSYNSAIFACVKARQSMQMSMLMARMRWEYLVMGSVHVSKNKYTPKWHEQSKSEGREVTKCEFLFWGKLLVFFFSSFSSFSSSCSSSFFFFFFFLSFLIALLFSVYLFFQFLRCCSPYFHYTFFLIPSISPCPSHLLCCCLFSPIQSERDDGFSPDVWTYSNLIRCLGDAMLWRRAVSILDDMLLASQDKEQRSVKPDAHCFNGAIRACAKVY